MDHICYFCPVLLCFHARLSVDALWPPAGKGLTSWLSFVMSNCHFPIGSLGQVWFLIVSFLIFALFLTWVSQKGNTTKSHYHIYGENLVYCEIKQGQYRVKNDV